MTLPYDDASRLTSAAYSEGNNNYNRYGAQYTYDCMGNMTSLKRNGLQDGGTYGLIDDLSFRYDGNRLMSVSDAVTDPTYNNAWNFKDGADGDFEYEYDENGNLTKDLNKNISSIQYNFLNLPTQILFADGNTIRYMYSADGRKLRAEYTTAMPATTKTIDYSGNLIFENGTLKQILVEGGYIMMDDWSNPYCLYVRDHLGNNRMVVNQRGTVDQVNNYYPYGGLMANSTGWNAQRYKYNGKELDRMHGLDWYDYGARWQDAAIGGRWHAMDPLCEKYYNVSPYVYCMNNPVKFVDPDGKKPHNWIAVRANNSHDKFLRENSAYHRSNYDDQIVNIWAHGIIPTGNPYGLANTIEMSVNPNGEYGREYSANDSKKIDQLITREDKDWQNYRGGNPIIVLHSCRASNFAKKLSATKEFQDVIIIAPGTKVTSSKDKGEKVKNRFDVNTKKVTPGKWYVYKNGKAVLDENNKPLTYNADEQPGTKGFDYRLPQK